MSAEQSSKYFERLTFSKDLLKGPVAWYLQNIRLTILLTLTIIVVGIFAYMNLPKRLNPEVKIPIVTVVTVLPGAGPEDVESLVTIPLENKVKALDGMDTVSSISQDNVSIITTQFVSSVDRDKARDNVQSAVDSVTGLPSDAQASTVTALDFENQPVWQFSLTTTEDVGTLQRFAKQLQDALEDEPKIDSVTIRGLEEQEIVIEADPEKVTSYGINPLALSQSLRSGLSAVPAGSLETANNTFAFTVSPSIESIEDIRNMRIQTGDSVIKLGDIATVVERSKNNQNPAFIATADKESARTITFSVFKPLNATITDSAEAAEAIVEEIVAPYKPRFSVITISNAAEDINEQFSELVGEFRSTIILVFIALLLFLGLKQAVISSFTVPLTFLSAFALMSVFGMSINFLTLFAFLLALGLLVDDTIVVISAMTTYHKTGKFTPLETGLLVWKDTIVPIWSTTLTTIWSFIPLLLATGIIGEFIKPIPIVVTVTMISSTAIAVLITLPIMMHILKPAFAKRIIVLFKVCLFLLLIGVLVAALVSNPLLIPVLLLFICITFVFFRVRPSLSMEAKRIVYRVPNYREVKQRYHSIVNSGIISLDGLAHAYQRLIQRIIRNKSARRNVVIAIVLYAIVGFLLLPTGFVKNEFFPKTDSERVYIQLTFPSGTARETVVEESLGIAQDIRSLEEVAFVTTEIGTGGSFDFGGSGDSANQSLLTLDLVAESKRTIQSFELAEELRKTYAQFTEAELSVLEQSGGPPAGADLQIELSGDNLSELNTYAEKVMAYLSEQTGVINPNKSIKQGTSALVFVPDLDKVSQAGLSVDAVGLWSRILGAGFTLPEVNFEEGSTEKTPVRFTFTAGNSSPEDLGRLMIQTPSGSVPLLSLGEIILRNNPTAITRTNSNRTITVTAALRPGYSATEKGQALEQFADTELGLSSGYAWKTGGVNEENQKSVQSILQAMGLAFLLILVTMVIQFKSFRQAAIVLLVIPLAVSSVFYVFALTGTPLSFPAIIGVLSLFGIVVTNSMFIVDKINLNKKEGMTFDDAVSDAGASRLEPIVLTKLTTVLGLLPITLSNPLWRGLGGAIISGLLVSSTIMLLFIPVVYYQLFKGESTKK